MHKLVSFFKQYLTCWMLSIIASLLVMIGFLADRHNNNDYIQAHREETQDQLLQTSRRLERLVTADIEKVHGLVSWIATHPELNRKDFEIAAAPLFGRGSNLRNIGVAPEMVIRMVYPVQGNEKAVGLDYRKVPEQFEKADLARTRGELVLDGPLQLIQGGSGLIGRLPVFINGNSGEKRFWGLVSAVIDVDALYDQAGLSELNNALDISIRFKSGDRNDLFYGSNEVFGLEPAMATVELPGVAWELAAVPRDGWPSKAEDAFEFRVQLLVLGLLIFMPIFYLLKTFKRLKSAEARVYAEKNRFLTTLESAPNIAVQWYDDDARVLYWNSASELVYGWKAWEAVGKTLDKTILTREQAEAFRVQLKDMASGKNSSAPVVFDTQAVHRNGSVRYIQSSLFAIKGEEEGHIYVCMDVDITDRKNLENELIDQAELNRAIADFTYDWESWLAPDEKLKWVNPAVKKLTGFGIKECMAMHDYPSAIIHPEDRENFMDTLKGSLRMQASVNDLTFKIIHKDKTIRWMAISWQPIYDNRGSYSGLRTSVRDITDRKKVELDLYNSRRKYQRLVDEIGDDFIVYSRDPMTGEMFHVSNGAQAITGIDWRAMIGANWADKLDFLPESVETGVEVAGQLLNGEKVTAQYEMQFRHPNGDVRTLHVSDHAVFDENGKIIAVEGIAEDITERKAAEIELQKSRDNYQRLVNDIGESFVVYSYDAMSGELLYASDGVSNVFGLDKEDVVGEKWIEKINWLPETRETAIEKTIRLASGEIDHARVEMSFIHPNGELKTIVASSHASRGENGDSVFVEGICEDITEQKRVLRALQSSEEKMRGLFELSPVGIALTDMDGKYIEFNDAFARICGYPADELKELDYWTLTPKRYADDEARQLESLKRTGHYGPYEKEYIRKDGSAVPIQLNGMLVHDRGGKQYIWSIVEDISDRKQRENMLRLAATAFDTQEAITITDPQGRIISVNAAFEEVTGYTANEVIGRRPNILASGKHDTHFYEKMWKELIATGRWKGEMINRRKNGELYPELLSITASKNEYGVTQNYIGVFSDISDKKELEKQLRHAQKMDAVGTLVSGIAHEFNNMLVGISGNVFLAKDMVEPGGEVYERLDSAETISFKAAKMIEQLLVFARKDFVDHESEPVNMVEWLPEGIKLSRSALPVNVQLDWDTGAESELIISGNTTQLQQVVMNLINNARDASLHREQPLIQIGLSSGKASPSFRKLHHEFKGYEYVCLTVRDNGTGIPADKIDKIFEPFYTTKDVGKGTGLGMPMIQGIVHSHHGCIEVESEEGDGTTFYVYFPRITEPKQKDQEQISGADLMEKGSGEVVLVADDEPDVLELTAEILKGLGYQVLTAKDGAEAVEIYEQQQGAVDLLLLDVMMPKLSGPNAAKKIRAKNPDIPILFCTGYSPDEMQDEMKEIANFHLIGKPIKFEALSSLVKRTLNKATG